MSCECRAQTVFDRTGSNAVNDGKGVQIVECDECKWLKAIGRAVEVEIQVLEIKREKDELLSDTEDDWLNSLQAFIAGVKG